MDAIDSGSSESGTETENESEASDPLELFFDLIFVFAFTRITAFISHNHTWLGVFHALVLLAALWWAWVTYTWLMDTIPAESVLSERVVILAATAVMFIVSLTVPNAFSETAVLFGVAYFVVRALHVALTLTTIDGEARDQFLRLLPGFLGGPALLLVAGFTDGLLQTTLWVVGIAIDYGILFVRGVAKFDLRAEHFVERFRSIVIIALGESVLAMGFGITGEGLPLSLEVGIAALLGIVLVAALSWLYFDYVTIAAAEQFAEAEGYARGVLARNSYAYLHFPIIAGILFVAFGLEETVVHATEPLGSIPAVGLYGGSALYLLGHNAFRFQDVGSINVTRLVTAGVACALLSVATQIPALAALVVLTVLLVGLVVFETVYSPIRHDVRAD